MRRSSGAKLRVEKRRVAVPTNKEERASDACEMVSRRVTD
jgi:hypothetical protein